MLVRVRFVLDLVGEARDRGFVVDMNDDELEAGGGCQFDRVLEGPHVAGCAFHRDQHPADLVGRLRGRRNDEDRRGDMVRQREGEVARGLATARKVAHADRDGDDVVGLARREQLVDRIAADDAERHAGIVGGRADGPVAVLDDVHRLDRRAEQDAREHARPRARAVMPRSCRCTR